MKNAPRHTPATLGLFSTLLLLAAPAALIAADPLPAPVMNALRRALDADATWMLQKTLPSPPIMLVSTGVVSCCADTGIVWRTLGPIPSTVTMTTNTLSVVSEDTNTTTPLRDLPHYARIRDTTKRLLAGDSRPLTSMVETQWLPAPTPEDSWTLTMRLRNAGQNPLFTSLVLTGGETLDRATFMCPDGSVLALSFSETGLGTHSLWRSGDESSTAEKSDSPPPAEAPAEDSADKAR